MSVKPYQRRRRARLYRENPFCPICGVKMILPDDIPKDGRGYLKYSPDNLCTIEHPVTKLEPEKRKNNREWLSILCKKCNEKKGREVELIVGIDELRKRSGRYPKTIK